VHTRDKQFNYETYYNSLVKYKLKLEYKHLDTTNIHQSRWNSLNYISALSH